MLTQGAAAIGAVYGPGTRCAVVALLLLLPRPPGGVTPLPRGTTPPVRLCTRPGRCALDGLPAGRERSVGGPVLAALSSAAQELQYVQQDPRK
jgi:hypothetical protein